MLNLENVFILKLLHEPGNHNLLTVEAAIKLVQCYIERTQLGDIAIAEVLFKTNIVALVGGP